ncbi:MAG: MBL fold metallo-hydrolase [Candidatus Thermoplasmatota archaeon]|jgi:putative mRNA 3-end processing factor|nr:MBL fold metallo-hydrolase [Candidatus Thermoplasmatota archaeon]
MKFRFLGGATEVGSLSMYMEDDGKRLLFDYGFTPSSPPRLPLPAPATDVVFLSHAHIDHSGLIPQLSSRIGTPVLSTPPTLDISEILWKDSHKICNLEGYPQMFSWDDLRSARNNFEIISFEDIKEMNGLSINFHSAGHIPGSMMTFVQGEKSTLFTGDLNTRDSRLLKGAKPVKCDNLIVEATYAGRDHKPRKEQEKEFIEKINEIVDRGGKVVLPAFAVGRTQELMMILKDQGFDIWVDGMGKSIIQIFLRHPAYLQSPVGLQQALQQVSLTYNPNDRKRALKGDVIITTSGMMDGGPVLQYVNHIRDDPKNAILLTGYQVEGTNGRRLLDKGTLKLGGVEQKINAEVGFFDFSAHCGHSELVEFIRDCDPENVILFHSEDREALFEDLKDEFNFILADTNEIMEI